MAPSSQPEYPSYPPHETGTKSLFRDEPRPEAGLQDVDVLSIPTERTPQARPEVSPTRGCRELVKRENCERVGSIWESRGLEGVILSYTTVVQLGRVY